MKQVVLFICLLVCLVPSVSFAEQQMVRGKLEQDKKRPAYTDKELDEALKISDDCKAYDRSNVRYDCDCVGMRFLDLRRKQGDAADSYWLRREARLKCPNAPAMAGKVYTECMQWAPAQRGEDYQEFCACYGSTFAKLFSQNPSDSLLVNDAQTVKAMTSCNVNAVNVRIQDRDAFVKQLKDSKIYDKLFPGAKDDPAAPPPYHQSPPAP